MKDCNVKTKPLRDVRVYPRRQGELILMQADGRVQTAQSLTPTMKGRQVRMDVSRASGGLYFLQVKQGLETRTKQVVIIR